MSLPDPIYLGKILLLQSTLHVIPENQIPAFVFRGLSSLPGLKSLSILLQKNYYAENKDVLLMEEDCRRLLYKTLEQKCPGSTENNSHIHRFEEKNQVKCLKIETSKELYGMLFLQITEKKVFQDYIPYVENTLNLIALVIENNLQKKMLTDKKAHLEKTVRERTIQLESTVSHLHSEIAERKKKEESLKTSEQRFLTVLDSIDATVYVADMDTYEILFMNQHMIERFGRDMTGKICWSVFRGEAGPCVHCTNGRLIDENGNPTGVHVWDDKNPVTGKWYINYDRAIEWMDGRLVRLQIATDVTEFKHMEEKLRQTHKMESVGRLAGGVAHDFNNMLGVILGHTELALLQADENHDLYDDLKEIQKAAKRSADITKQLLAFARKQPTSPRPLDLNDTVESMLNMLRRLIGEDIHLAWKPSAHLWPVKMDPSQIDQILANLCVNARDAISGVGKLTIETGIKTFDEEYCKEQPGFIPGDFALLAVSDNGCGMDKDTLENLFEPFFTTKEVGKGTGLGLSTIYGIVKQNKGFINVNSEPGQGSTFKIYLPRLVAEEDTDKAVPEKKPAAGGTETILLVEDEPTILRMTRMMLERKGYSVLSAATPTEAVDKAKEHSGAIDLLMTDVVMPEMNGRDLAGQLIPLYPEIKLLFMSGYTSNVIAHHGVLDKGVAFIQKPFSMADMTEKVWEVLDTAPGQG